MAGHAKKCVERYCELANKTTQQLYKVSTPCIDDHQFKEEEIGSVGEMSKVCSQIVLKCLHLARIGRPDILWSVNKLARVVTRWTKACYKCLARLISYIHHTCEFGQYCYMGNSAQQCSSGLFEDSDFAGDFEDSKSTSVGLLCIFGSETFVQKSRMCKKQIPASHSSTEAEVMCLDAGLRMDVIPALDLWDLVVEVFQIDKPKGPELQGNLLRSTTLHTESQNSKKHVNLDLDNVDHVSSNVRSSEFGAMLYVFEDNEVVIEMITKGRSPTMRHVSMVVRQDYFGTQNSNPSH